MSPIKSLLTVLLCRPAVAKPFYVPSRRSLQSTSWSLADNEMISSRANKISQEAADYANGREDDKIELEEAEEDNDEDLLSGKGLKGLKSRKVRQHVNPLSFQYQTPLEFAPTWLADSFQKPTQPLVLDIGCARGTWATKMAQLLPETNFLGVEIRKALVEYAQSKRDALKLLNLHFLSTNINVNMDRLLVEFQRHSVPVQAVLIQFPDPLYKKKHKKRRVVTPEFVNSLSQLSSGTKLYVQSDLPEVVADAVETALNSSCIAPAEGYDLTRLDANPPLYSLPTEREISCVKRGYSIHRMLLVRK